MLYLLASFYDVESDNLVGLRVINVDADGVIGEFFDVTKEDMLKLISEDKVELYKIYNEKDMNRWCKYTSMFNVKTGNLINDVRYVKLNDVTYADCLGKIYKARNLAELDNFVMNHKFTYLEGDEENMDDLKDKDLEKTKKVKKTVVKKEKSDDEMAYKSACAIGKYEKVKELTEKYKENISYGPEVQSHLLDIERAGRFNFILSDKKLGTIEPCRDDTTGLYGVCCVYDDYVWVILEPIYKQVETVQSNTSTYIAVINEKGLWEFIDIKKDNKLGEFIDWISVNNAPGKNGKLFVVTSGDERNGYIWKLVGKGLTLDRQIGCHMIRSDALYSKGRGYTNCVNTLEFYDPRHGETILINLKDYSMDSMMNFRRTFSKQQEKSENEELVLYYNVTCDATTGEISFETDKGAVDARLDMLDINSEFITSITSFLGVAPKDLVLDKKVKRHIERRHQFIYQKVPVDNINTLKFLLSHFANYTSAKVLGNYWTYKNIDTIEKALDDVNLDKFKSVSKCNDGNEIYYKGSIVTHIDKSVDLISFVRRKGRVIRVDYTNILLPNGEYTEELKSSEGLSDFIVKNIKDTVLNDISIEKVEVMNQSSDISSKPTQDIVQKYKKNKLSLKCTEYKNVVELKLGIKIDNNLESESLDDLYNIYLKLYDGLSFRTSEIKVTKLSPDDERTIEDVREHAKTYNKIMNENQPVISGFHVSAFKFEII